MFFAQLDAHIGFDFFQVSRGEGKIKSSANRQERGHHFRSKGNNIKVYKVKVKKKM